MLQVEQAVILGVDTHDQAPVGVLIDAVGRRLGTLEVAATPQGYRQLVAWRQRHGALQQAGVEGTGSMAPHSPAASPVPASR